MPERSIQKAIPTILAVAVLSMMASLNLGSSPTHANIASSEPTPYSADHARIAASSGDEVAPPTF